MKTGILLTNLGTPDAPTERDLRRYLRQYLSDPRVVNPENFWQKLGWKFALNFIILRKRPKVSAENYAKIWDKFGPGSPLLNITKSQLNKLSTLLSEDYDNLEFAFGMRYGNPSIHSALRDLRDKGCSEVIILPLYPQQSGPTTDSTVDVIQYELGTWTYDIDVAFIENYFNHPKYINALANSVKNHQKHSGKPEKLIMSYHGMPQRYIDNGDVYYEQCLQTSKLLASKLKLDENDYIISFQSVFGKEEWIKPYTDATLKSLANDGVKHVQVICPGFSADCLETLEEIEVENKNYFISAGGDKFSYVPALNDNDDHIDMIYSLITRYLDI